MSKLVRGLYKTARLLNDLETLLSLNPKRIGRRVLNKAIGRRVFPKLTLKGRRRKTRWG
jgi:hypothetical protein